MKITKYVFVAALLASMVGCNYLDYDQTSGRTKDEAYSYYANLNSLTAYVYSFLPSDFGKLDGVMMESATDNSVYTWKDNSLYFMFNGSWSPLLLVDDNWNYFTAIRSANSFLENYDISVLENSKYNADYDEITAKASKFPYEVRFLRAFYYFELAIRYGDIPLLTRTYAPEEINKVAPTPFADVIKFIVDECDAVAPQLPVSQKAFWGDTGRATKGAALALKSRALLYAASLWHNPGNDKAKWADAAKAAYAIIGSGTYQLPKNSADPLYDNKGGNTVLTSPQLIFERRNPTKSNTFEASNQPMGYEGAQGGNTPSQNLVDAYEMNTGEAFNWNNPVHVSNMYYNSAGKPTRDPRLYRNVLVNGTTWLTKVIDVTEGGWNNVLAGSTPTGYYLRKYMNPSVSLDPVKPNKIEHHYILFRYAEILLNYAEAMNEWVGPDAVGEGCPMTARQALNLIRTSADMPAVTETGSAFTQKLRNERRVELAFEGHRFWDIRRWKIAGNDEVKKIYGVKITKTNNVLSFERKLVEERIWNDKMYLYPYPQNELYMNNNLKQNPGWE